MGKKIIIGRCALCHNEKELRESHIIPKFVIRYLKKTSIGNIRVANNPNKPVQDGEKHYLLCGDCEGRFNSAETPFSKRIFYPYIEQNQDEFHYEEWLHYFITSVSWRNLYLDITDFTRDGNIEIDDLQVLLDSEKIMRDYLMKERNDIASIENHIFFFNDIKKAYEGLKELRPHMFFTRSEGGYTFYNSSLKTYMTVSNLMGIIIISIYKKGKEEYWDNTQVFNKPGIIKAKNQHIQSILAQELHIWMEQTRKYQEQLTDVQKDKILSNIENKKEEFLKSKAFEQMMKDRKLK